MTLSPALDSPAVPRLPRADLAFAALFMLGYAVVWAWQVRASEGFLEADACTHYLIARFAFDEPFRFVDVWGRPFKTFLYAGPAYLLGRVGVQATSLLLAWICGAVAMLLARDHGLRRPVLALVFTLASPLVFLHSFSELTELPFAALLAVAFYAFTRRWYLTAALLAGLLPLARPEGFGILALAAVALAWRRRWAELPMLAVGLIVWSYVGWEAYGRDGPYETAKTLPNALRSIALWIPTHWPYAGESVYQKGPILKFTALLPALVGPAVFPALLVGTYAYLRASLNRTVSNRAARAMTVGLPLFVLAAHSVLYALGKMASNGELRYLLVVAPFWGLLTAAGWQRLTDLFRRSDRESLRFSVYAALVPLFLNTHFYTVLPIRFDNAWETTRFVAHWAARYGKAHDRPAIMAADPGVFYFLDRSQNDGARAREFITKNIQHPPRGTMLLYDPMYARYNASRDRRVEGVEEIRKAGWLEHPYMTIGGWHIFFSPEPTAPDAEGPLPPPAKPE